MSPTIGVDADLYRDGVHVASLWPAPVRQADPPRCYAVSGWEEDEAWLAAYRAAYTERTGLPAPSWTLEQWREPDKRK